MKLIAEPWDVGAGRLPGGRLPAPAGASGTGATATPSATSGAAHEGTLPDLATRLAGSSDLYGRGGRRPTASINFVTAHDGFTLRDLVSYDHKHNEANGEDNRDGTDDNRSLELRRRGPDRRPRRSSRCAPASGATCWPPCCSSQGVPMILGGDELGRTQGGNNNAYCQDDATSWIDWDAAPRRDGLTDFTGRLLPPAARAPRIPPARVPARRALDPGRHRRPRLAAPRRAGR